MPRVEQLFLMTADLETTRGFFEKGLRLTPSKVGESSIEYDTDGSDLKIQADFPPEVFESYNLASPMGADRGVGAVHVLSLDEGLDQVHQRLADTFAEYVVLEPREVPWGGRILLIQDPNGYLFEIRSSIDAESG